MKRLVGWKFLLEDDEQIIWQGRPDGSFTLKDVSVPGVLFGLFFSGFSIFWIHGASQANIVFSLFGLPFLLTGLWMVGSCIFGSTFVRRRSWYTLTDRRAYVATWLPLRGRRLKSNLILDDKHLEFVDEEIPSVYFAVEKSETVTVIVNFQLGLNTLLMAARFMQ
ncbi:MAG: aspartate carbamoyltransferase catalytic subunit [Pseudomonadota bacterium]